MLGLSATFHCCGIQPGPFEDPLCPLLIEAIPPYPRVSPGLASEAFQVSFFVSPLMLKLVLSRCHYYIRDISSCQ